MRVILCVKHLDVDAKKAKPHKGHKNLISVIREYIAQRKETSMSIVAENLGKLAAKCDVEAANMNLTPNERWRLIRLSGLYREAQTLELQKVRPEGGDRG